MDEPTLQLYGEIGPSMYGLIDDVSVIRALAELKGSKKIHVRLNSPGGDYFMGASIRNALAQHEAKIVIHVDALAASAASVIAMGGDTVIMHPGSLMMIHRAWTISMGNAEDMTRAADALNKVDESLIGVYHNRTGLDKAKLRQLVDAETWMTGPEAVQYGFADESDSNPTGARAAIPAEWQNKYSRTPDNVGRYSIAAVARKPQRITAPSRPTDESRFARIAKCLRA